MQRDERFFSRGNVAVAALLLVTAIGAAAVALDSARLQNVRSQVAAGEAAKTSGISGTDKGSTDGEVKGKCDIGYDYEIREVKGKPEVKPRGTSQCPKIDATTPYKDPEGKIRYCSKDGWKCRYFYCKPDELRLKNDKGVTKDAECMLMGSAGKPGEQTNLTADRTQGLKDAVEKKLFDPNATKEEIKAAASYAQSLDKNVQASLLNSFDPELQKQKFAELEKEYGRAKDNLVACLAAAVPGACDNQAAAVDTTKQQMDEQKQKLEILAKNAQPLGEAKKILESSGPPGGAPCAPNCGTKEVPPPGTDVPCEVKRDQAKCNPSRFPADPNGNGGNPGGSPGNSPSSGASGFNPSQLMSLLGGLLSGAMQQAPTCTITASPKNITQPGQPVTISWQSQGAQAAYISNLGQVGPSGSTTISPQQTTTVTMQVIGHPQQGQQQQYNPYGGGYGQQQGQYVWNPQLGAYVYMQGQQQQQQNPYMQIGQQIGQAIGGGGGGQQAQCQTQITVGADGGGGNQKAQISCQPKIADVGMQVAISYACQNSVASKGEGFATDNKLSGSAQATVASPTPGSTSVKYGLTCSKDGQTDSAECTVNVNKPSIVLVANPKNIKSGETSTIGWVTGAMESCIVSSPTLTSFTNENKNNTSTSGVAKTPGLTQNTKFVLSCTTKAGGTKTAETTVEVN